MEMNFSNSTFPLEEVYKCPIYDWQLSDSTTPDSFALVEAIFDFITFIFSVFGNGLVVFTIYRSRSLHSPSHLLIAGLALSDFGTGLITQPSHLAEYMAAIHGDICTANIAVLVYSISGWVFTMLSLLTLTFIAIERYCAVVFHLRYNEIVTMKRTMTALLCAWIIIPLASSLIAVKEFDAGKFLLAHGILILIGISLACLCYFKVFLVVRRHLSQINMQLQVQTGSGHLAYDTTRLRRKFVTVLYIVGAFVVCYLPYSISILAYFNKRSRVMSFTVLLGGNSCINSVIYFWRIKELREAAKRHVSNMFKCCSNN